MAIIYKKNNYDFSLAVWQITESLGELINYFKIDEKEKYVVEQFKNDQRKLQWLISRILIQQLLNAMEKIAVVYDEYGKPHLANSDHKISISHSKNYVAVILSKEHKVAIDIELIEPRIEKLSNKFMTSSELASLHEEGKIEQMYIVWCAKEALYKLYGKKELDFKKHLFTEPFEYRYNKIKGKIKASISKNNFHKSYSLCYERMHALMLVYVCN